MKHNNHKVYFDNDSFVDTVVANLSERKIAGKQTIQIRVKWVGATDSQIKKINADNKSIYMRKVDGQEVYLVYFESEHVVDIQSIIDVYAAQPFVELVEANIEYVMNTGRDMIHNVDPQPILDIIASTPSVDPLFDDPEYRMQWYFSNIGQFGGVDGEDVKLEEAIRYIRDNDVPLDNEIVLAILDDGLDPIHQDLNNANTVLGFDLIDGDDEPVPDGSLTHGTNVAGIIYATVNNGLGVVGINPSLKILIGRMIRKKASTATPSWAASAIRIAVDNGAKIINMSWGMPNISGELLKVINDVSNKALMVVAAGNYVDNNDTDLLFPGSLDNVLTVGACDDHGRRITLENCSADVKFGSRYGRNIDLVAPGINIFTTLFDGAYSTKRYAIFNGTSAAAPIVSGVASLLLAIRPSLTVAQLKQILIETCDDISAQNPGESSQHYGAGRLNALSAIQRVVVMNINESQE